VRRQSRRNFHRLPVGQSEKGAVDIGKILDVFRRFDKFQLSLSEKVAMDIRDGLPGMFICGDEVDLDGRMCQQNAQ
jgi:hypothetical protein